MSDRPEDPAVHRLAIARILNNARFNQHAKRQNIWNYIIHWEMKSGSTFLRTKEGGLHVILGETGEFIPIPHRGGDKILSHIYETYGIAERDQHGRVIYDILRAYAYKNSQLVEFRRFSAYNDKTRTAYLSAYNGKMWKICGDDDPVLVRNGEDEIYFADDDGGISTKTEIGPHQVLQKHLTSLNYSKTGMGGITPEQQARTLMIWIFALALPDLMPTKPLLMLEGAQGAGKSAAVQLVQLALMGDVKPLSLKRNHEDDFGILLLRSPIAIFDNTDSYIEWIADAVCSYTTSGVFPRRKLYSDDEEVIIKPHAFIAVASKNPASFRREDVADRCLILRLDRRVGFKTMKRLKEETTALRPKLVGEYLWCVNRIIEEIRAGALDEANENETSRMADFAALGRVVATVMNWPEGTIDELMDALQNERDAFVNEEDPLVEILHKWIAYRPRSGGSNINRVISIHTLFLELETLADASGIQFYKSPRQLVQKLRSPHVERDFDVTMIATDGHKSYTIKRKRDPKLGVIEGGLSLEQAVEEEPLQ